MSAESPVAQAERALATFGDDPRAALALADSVVAAVPRPRTPDDVRAVVTAHRAAGLALRDLGDPAAGAARLRKAAALADRRGDDVRAAEARMSLAYVLLELGQMRPALLAIDHASATTDPALAPRVRTTRALVLQRWGRTREALAEYDVALAALVRQGDLLWEARLRNNRALLHAYEGDSDAAVADLQRAGALYAQLGLSLDTSVAVRNLAWVLGMAGDVPGALRMFDESDRLVTGVEAPERWTDHAEVLLRAGLAHEAVTSAARAVSLVVGRGWDSLEAESRLLHALALLATDDAVAGGAEADRARAMFVKQARPGWTALSDYVSMKAAFRTGASRRSLARASDVASQLADVGWEGPASDLRVTAAAAALGTGDRRSAQALLGPLAADTRATRVEVRSRSYFARGLLAEMSGSPDLAVASLRRAWATVDDHRMMLGATELRAGAATHTTDIVAAGLRVSLARGSAPALFEWAEKGRTAALRPRPAVPPSDPDLARALSRLRWVAREDEDARLDGRADVRAASRRRSVEGEVVRLSRAVGGPAAPRAPVSARDVARRAGSSAFLMYLTHGDALHCVVVTARGAHHVELGSVSEADRSLRRLTFAHRRLLTGFGTEDGLAESRRVLAQDAQRLDRLLLAPVVAGIAEGELVVCPTAALASVPWALLPSTAGRGVRVAPSATLWCEAVDRPARTGGTVAVAGPGLEHARREVVAIGAADPSVTVLVNGEATAGRVLAEALTARTLHIAAHGRLRRDNPLFSALELADGPVTGYDLEGLLTPPETVVLSACSAGAGHASVGEETLGLVWTLLSAGSRAVVAPLIPVPDEATEDLMLRLHQRVRQGRPLAAALGEVQQECEPDLLPAAAAFVALGA